MPWLKKVYLYLFSAVGLVLMIIGSVQLVNLGLKTYVFTKADVYPQYPMAKPTTIDEEELIQQPNQEEMEKYQREDLTSRRQRQAANAIAMLLIGIPLFTFHWRIIRKEK